MKRVITVAATLAVAASAATAAAVVPAMAAPRPAAAQPAAHAKAAAPGKPDPQTAPAANSGVVNIGSELDGGKYVTTVNCHGVDTPPPITAGAPGTPLTVHGTGPSAAILATLAKPNAYKTVYVCTVVVKMKPAVARTATCEIGGTTRPMPASGRCTAKKVTLNTGFGGEAGKVAAHHPAG